MAEPIWTQLPRSAEDIKSKALLLPEPIADVLANPDAYVPDDGLVTAANVALLLGQPLLVTGEPGCGKTAFAYWLARQLGLGEPLTDVVKSTSSGRDLLYEFDSLARFRDSQVERPKTAQVFKDDDDAYVRFRALGAAIAAAADPTDLSETLRRRVQDVTHFEKDLDAGRQGTSDIRRRYVVLIDELDKAPRDTPNDLLHEIDRMAFTISEVDRRIEGDPAFRPIVVITSNSEKSLPDPFLRRCVYYNIPDLDSPKGKDRLETILESRAKDIENGGDKPFADSLRKHGQDSFQKFLQLRKSFEHKPGTAEFLALTIALARQELAAAQRGVSMNGDVLWRAALTSIVKTREDREKALKLAVAVRS